MKLPDRSFFDILRNYLGPVKTPYNKHTLITRLTAFITKPDIVQRISSLITPGEEQILSALDILAPVTRAHLLDFLQDQGSAASHVQLLRNLEDRLLIFTDSEGCLALNPYLAPHLRSHHVHRKLLIPSSPRPPEDRSGMPIPWLNEALILSILLIIQEGNPVYKQDGKVRKKFHQDLLERITVFLGSSQDADLAVEVMLRLGLIRRDGRGLVINRRRLDSFGSLTSQQRHFYLWAGALTQEEPQHDPQTDLPDYSDYFFLGSLNRRAEELALLIQSLDPDQWYSTASVPRLWALRIQNRMGTRTSVSELSKAIRILTAVGVLNAQTSSQSLGINPNILNLDSDHSQLIRPGGLILQSDFSATLQPWMPLNKVLPLSPLFRLTKADYLLHFKLDQGGAERLFMVGYSHETLIQAIQELTQSPIPQNILVSIGEWYRRFSAVSAQKGILLRIEPEYRAMLSDPQVQPLGIIEVIPGWYFLPEPLDPQWRQTLNQAGLPTLGLPSFEDSREPGLPSFQTIRIPRPLHHLQQDLELEHSPSTTPTSENSTPPPERSQHIQRLKHHLASMELGQDTRLELTMRIERGLILIPDQLRPEVIRKEQTEAGALDHTAKIRLIEQAIQLKDYLELTLSKDSGQTYRLLVNPLSIKHPHQDTMLLGETIPEYKELSITVSRIQHMRRIRGPLFPQPS